MSSIHSIIQSATTALAELSPQTLTIDHINSSTQKLDAININDAIDEYWRSLPPKPEEENRLSEWEASMREKSKEINHDLHQFNEELKRVKSMKQTLSLDALEPLISAAQQIIRPLYDFTAELSS